MFKVTFYNRTGKEVDSYDLEDDENIWTCLYVYEAMGATDAKVSLINDLLARNGEDILFLRKVKQGKKWLWVVKE